MKKKIAISGCTFQKMDPRAIGSGQYRAHYYRSSYRYDVGVT